MNCDVRFSQLKTFLNFQKSQAATMKRKIKFALK